MGDEQKTANSSSSGAEGGKRMESLGWLTESAVMPKKHKAIEGVGASSIVELKAQLYRSQEEARKAKETAPPDAEFLRAKKKPLPSDVFSHKNSGVDARDRRDKLELKAMNDGTTVYAALEKKSQLYEKLANGELSDEEEREKYCVDFFQKTLEHERTGQPESQGISCGAPQETDGSDNDDLLSNGNAFGLGRASSRIDKEEHKRFIREVHQEANQARQMTSTLKQRRQEQEAARREKLRHAYLRKQLEKLTSAKQTAATGNPTHVVKSELDQK